MPTFYSDLDIEPRDFLNACRPYDIEALTKYLIEDGYIKDPYAKRIDNVSIPENLFKECLNKISVNYLQLTLEEEEIIRNIAKRLP